MSNNPLPSVPSFYQGHRPRTSLSNSISLGPQSLVQSLLANSPTAQSRERPHRPPADSDGSPRVRRVDPRIGFPGHKLDVNGDTDNDGAGEVGEGTEKKAAGFLQDGWGSVDRFRLWRHDAMMQHLYESAIFWGDKVLTWTGDPNDAFWLAQAHFLAYHYSRAESLLTREFVVQVPHEQGKSKEPEHADLLARGNMPLMGGIKVPEEMAGCTSRLVDMSIACRYLAAQCLIRCAKWDEALEMLGESNPFREAQVGPLIPQSEGGVRVESTMCYLRGVLLLRMGRYASAKENLMEALVLDVKNFDAFDTLIGGDLMTVDEEWEFVQGLEYSQAHKDDAEFVRCIYTIRLRKYKHVDAMALCRQQLANEFGMSDNPDVLYGFADVLFHQYRYSECYAITSRILEKTSIHMATLPLHIACMQHLPHLHPKLFLLAHELVEKEPEAPISWYAVGVWYVFTGKYHEARKYFAKCSLMDPRNGPSWIGFAHSFAFEGEHDQAIIAYSTSARLFQGTHIPMLYIGMEYIQMHNLRLAQEYLESAFQMCDSDPLLLNELGVLHYQKEMYEDAAKLLNKAIDVARIVQTSEKAWTTSMLNLGQAYRKLGRFSEAKQTYRRVVDIDPRHGKALACLGMLHHLMDELDDAITRYHEALLVDPLDTNIIELLNIALEANADMDPLFLGARGLPAEKIWQEMMLYKKHLRDTKPSASSQEENIPVDEEEGQAVGEVSMLTEASSAMDIGS